MSKVKEIVKKINIITITILFLLCYFLCNTFFTTVVKFLPWLSIPILIGCVLYIFVTPILGCIVWTIMIIFVILKSLVDMTIDSEQIL